MDASVEPGQSHGYRFRWSGVLGSRALGRVVRCRRRLRLLGGVSCRLVETGAARVVGLVDSMVLERKVVDVVGRLVGPAADLARLGALDVR